MNEVFRVSSLYECLKDNKIVIPLIQRDYAQGRSSDSVTEKRTEFLHELKNAIENNKEIILDIVYGNENEEDREFYPLDGQQRLTTLWLLHWYIAFKRGVLPDNEWLKKLTYKVRISSTEFCERICEMTKNDLDQVKDMGISIAQYIQIQPWFYSRWIQDPTINSMLRTISGKEYKRGEDSLEGLFTDDIIKGMHLKTKKIRFNVLEIPSKMMKDTDNLYVKMNSRGKQLSDYENFKADFIGLIKNDKSLINGKELSVYYPEQFDIEWTDALWNYHNASGEIDEIYFALINRLLLNESIVQNDFSASIAEGFRGLYSYDKNIKYNSFNLYNSILEKTYAEILQKWDKLFKLIKYYSDDLLAEINTVIEEDGQDEGKGKVSLIPSYAEYEKAKTPTQKDRVYLFAICEFVKRISREDINRICNDDKKDTALKDKIFDQYKKWMRFIGNLIENAEIDREDTMIYTMKLIFRIGEEIDKIDKKAGISFINKDIYEAALSLKTDDLLDDGQENDNARNKQLDEEIEKAGIIVEGWNNPAEDSSTYEDRERAIVEAEEYAFFNGNIRFLISDEQGVFVRDKDLFDKKYKNAQKLFKGSDATDIARKEFRKLIGDVNKIYEEKDMSITSLTGYQKRDFSWKKRILNNSKFYEEMDMLLSGGTHNTTDKFILDREELFQEVDKIEDEEKGKQFMCDWYYDSGEIVLHRKNSHTDYIFLSDERKEYCKALRSSPDIEVENTPIGDYYMGAAIHFHFKSNMKGSYVWKVRKSKTDDGTICINRIYKSEDGEESSNYMLWTKPDNLKRLDGQEFKFPKGLDEQEFKFPKKNIL